jgi:tetratricopeptide (TPR) repeat protein
MSEHLERSEKNTTAAFAALTRIAKPGQIICFCTASSPDALERIGILVELNSEGLVIDTNSGIEWISAQSIQSWRLPKQTEQAEPSPKLTIPQVSLPPQEEPAKTNNEATQTTVTLSPGHMPTHTDKSLPAPADLELLFSGDPMIPLPAPSFSFPSLSKEIQQYINRWKNRYDYAQKVREPARMTQDVAKIAELAETLENPSLFFLAGLLSEYSGLGDARSKSCFQKTLELDQNHQQASTAMAALAIRSNDWETAVKFLLWAARLEGETDKAMVIRCIGQCIRQLENKNFPPIGLLLTIELPETARRFATNLLALSVREDSEAYAAALSGDINRLRQTITGNDLFPWKDEFVAPVKQKIDRPLVAPIEPKGNCRYGRISAYYPARNFGFVVEDSTGQTWFFHKNAITNSLLLSVLLDGQVRQEITFTESFEVRSGKYPLAKDIALVSEEDTTQEMVAKRAPLKLRLLAIPKDGSFFSKAMEAEQLDQLDRAESFYREEISRNGRHIKSAVKNLAALKNRKGKPDAAIEILDRHKNAFDSSESVSLDQMRVQFYVKARNFTAAAQLLEKLAKTVVSKRLEYQRQQAYCYLANGEFDEAINLLNSILKKQPWDNASTSLLAKAKDAKETGQIPFAPESGVDSIEDDILSSLALGLSPIARQKIDSCELRGIDPRTKESRNFTDSDVRQVQNLLDNVKGRRPRERSDYLLSLAWLCKHASSVTGNRSVHEYLRRYFLSFAEAALSDGTPTDVGRCFCVESLTLCPAQMEPGREARDSFEAAWTLLLGTYLPNSVEPSDLLQPSMGNRLPKVLKKLNEAPKGWDEFLQHVGFYALRAPEAFRHLQLFLKTSHMIPSSEEYCALEKARENGLKNAFDLLPRESLSVDKYRKARENLSEMQPLLCFELDRSRMSEFLKILDNTASYILERNFRERETRYLRLIDDISRLMQEVVRHPTHMCIERMESALESLQKLVNSHFEHTEIAQPDLELRNVLDNDFYVLSDGAISLRLLLLSKDEGVPPIEAIGLSVEDGDHEPCHSPDPLYGGQAREIELTLKPTAEQIRDGAFSVSVKVDYRNRKGNIQSSGAFPLAVRLGKPAFDEIPNPYGRYSGGSPVEDKEMFFGRASLIDRVIRHLSTGTMGQCFVLYGQKRSGKSSVLKQVEHRLGEAVIYAPISAGTFSPGNLWCSFARILLQELRFRLEDANVDIPKNWPSRSDMEASPLETIREVVRGLTKQEIRIILAIDEFTYIFESGQADIQAFMRGWKALLEAKAFNALLVGQDTMPRFKQAFPNEFGVTHDERITYLDRAEAEALASDPIRLDGCSRYRGQAQSRLFDLTAGSPFFMQIFCDRLVRHINLRNAAFITEADIEQVARMLTIGTDALPPERFDALVTAAGENVANVPRNNLWQVLGRIARESLHSGWCYRASLSELPRIQEVLADLSDREILIVEGERVRIRVGLFAAWLRANQHAG